MKILIAASIPANGGYEEEALANALYRQLHELGYEADYFFLPYENDILSLPEQLLAYRLLKIGSCDELITIGYPACILEHHSKTVYLFQTEPAICEYWDSEYGVLANFEYFQIANSINKIEYDALHKSKSVKCNSEILACDLKSKYHLETEILYCPPLSVEKTVEMKRYNNYIICESNLVPYCRPELIIKLAEELKEKKIKIFIPNKNITYYDMLLSWISLRELDGKIEIYERAASDEEIKKSDAVFVPDYNSRRIPNIVIKGIFHNRPVYAMKDSGAICELINSNFLISEQQLLNVENSTYIMSSNNVEIPDIKFFTEKMIRK